MTETETTAEAVKQTLAEYERLAISTGATVQIDAPEFSRNGITWSPVWCPETLLTDDHPQFARVTVHRDGIPTTVYVSWDEALPAEDSWRQLWLRKPMTLFGAFTIRAALRRAFRDVIGDRHEPDDLPDSPPAPETPAEPIDWEARIDDVRSTADAITLHKTMKDARAVTPALEVALRAKMKEVAGDTPVAVVSESGIERTTMAEHMSRPKPAPPAVRPADTVRKPRTRKGGK